MVYEVMMLVVYMWYGVYVQLCSGGGCCYEKERGGLKISLCGGGGYTKLSTSTIEAIV